MDFSRAVKAKKGDLRNGLIESEIYHESWADYLENLTEYGGWPEDECVDKIEITDNDSEPTIKVIVTMSFTESVASSCHDYNHTHNGWAQFVLRIDRIDGCYDIDGDPDIDIDDGTGPHDEDDDGIDIDDPEIYPGDYF